MFIRKADYTQLFVKVVDSKPITSINYKLVETTGKTIRSIDRGQLSDSYACEFTFRGKKPYIKSIVDCLNGLRAAKLPVVLSALEEPFFGYHILTNEFINAPGVVLDISEIIAPALKVQEITVKIVLDTTALVFIGAPILPSNLKCLQSKWSGGNKWGTQVNKTYFNSLYFVDSKIDMYTFKGSYSLSPEDLTNLQFFHRTQRGAKFTIQEQDWGVSDMFGYSDQSSEHEVIIKSIEYDRISGIRMHVTIELIKVG